LASSSSSSSSSFTATTAARSTTLKRSERVETRSAHESWSCDDVAHWLSHQLRWSDALVAAFQTHQIDGFVLARITRDELAELIGTVSDDLWREFRHHIGLLLSVNRDSVAAAPAAASLHAASHAASSVSINDALDDAALAFILERLTFTSFTTVTRVCRRWHRLFHTARLWMPLCVGSWRRVGLDAVQSWQPEDLLLQTASHLVTRAAARSTAPIYVVHGLTTLRFAVSFLTREVRSLCAALSEWAVSPSAAADIADARLKRDASCYATVPRDEVPLLRRLSQQWQTLHDFLQLVARTCVCLLRHHIVLHAREFEAICQSLYLLDVRLRLCNTREPSEHAAVVITRQPFPFPVRLHDRLGSISGIGPLEVRLTLSPFVSLVDECSVRVRVAPSDALYASGSTAPLGASAPVRLEHLVFRDVFHGRLCVRCEAATLAARSPALVSHVVPSATLHVVDLQALTAPLSARAGDAAALVLELAQLVHGLAFADGVALWNVLVQALNGVFVKAVRPVSGEPRGLSQADIVYLHERFFERRRVVTHAMFHAFWQWFAPVVATLRYRRHMATLWACGLISGFVSRQETDQRLTASGLVVGTFILRFSESEAGAITISKVAAVQARPAAQAPLPMIRHYVLSDGEHLATRTLPELLLTDDSLVDVLQERHIVAYDCTLLPACADIDDAILLGGDPAAPDECDVVHEPECRVHVALQKRSKRQVLRQFWRADQLRHAAGPAAAAAAATWQVTSDDDLSEYASLQSLQDLVFV
jgi:hypothetical protein